MEDGIFPSYMTITSDDPSEMEEERRLCYVGITRAMKRLNLSCARMRMIRGETQYNPMSRFLKEIPKELFAVQPAKEKVREIPKTNTFTQAKANFRGQSMLTKQFTVKKAEGLTYGIGDRVSHMKFGQGTVLDITEGGRDYEVQVEFDTAGIKKMFASFAKLQKI